MRYLTNEAQRRAAVEHIRLFVRSTQTNTRTHATSDFGMVVEENK